MEQKNQTADRRGLNVVAIGGGNGLSTLLSGLKQFVLPGASRTPSIASLTAIVTVTDNGGSSGRLRDERQMLPPGDIRNCMVALSEDSLLLSKLFRHRFEGDGGLAGHSFGNLFLAALTEITGDFAEAVKLSSEVLASKGRIYPATVADVHIGAELEDGSKVLGETNISKVGPSIRRLYLEPADCRPMPEALKAIAEADVITLGPGSLFTSILPPLLVSGVPDAIAASTAVRIFVGNLMTQPGETDGFSSFKHVETLKRHAPEIDLDFVLLNDKQISQTQREIYFQEGSEQISGDQTANDAVIEGARLVYDNLLDDGEKVRHDPNRLATAVLACVGARRDLIVEVGVI